MRERNSALYQTELESLHRSPADDNIEEVPDEVPFDPPTYPGDPVNGAQERVERPVWEFGPKRKVIDIITIIYSTYRSIAAVIVNILALAVKNTRITLSSPSNLLLALLAAQIQLQNFALPTFLRLLLALDVLLLAAAYGLSTYPRLPAPKLGYAELTVTGGNCAVYASNCFSQSETWSEVGCGNWTSLMYFDVEDDDTVDTGQNNIYVPYATSGNINQEHNPLHTIECIFIVFGSIWLVTALYQIYNLRYIILPMKRSKTDTKRGRCHWMLQDFVPFFGTLGAVGAALLSIGGHMGQELRPHRGTYLDSFGPVGGNASWSDCFVVEAPRGMEWKTWMDYNKGVLWRFGALV
jgi:hypothetical protein